jgi:radical SAM superfamily enzyme YgiQ (UPF0313 family)
MDIILLTSILPSSKGKMVKAFERPSKDSLPYLYRGLGAYQLAWYLREHQYSVQVIDYLYIFTEEEILSALAVYIDESTKILGLGLFGVPSQYPFFFPMMEKILAKIRVLYPWITIVGGGPTIKIIEGAFSPKTFDYVISGHAEDTMLALSNYLIRSGKRPQFEISARGHKVIREAFAMPVENKFDIQHCRHRWHPSDFILPKESLPLELTRGCRFKCKFCQFPHIGKKKNDFLRDMQLVKDELIFNYENYSTTNYYILDDTFNANADRVLEFSDMVATLPFKINYIAYLRLDLIEAYPDTAYQLLNSGLIGAFFGIESFNLEAAKMVGKAFNGKKAKEFLPRLQHEIWKDRVSVYCSFISGFPQETFEEMKETNRWCIENKISCWIWNPLFLSSQLDEYSSEFERESKKYGFNIIEGTENQWEGPDGSTSERAYYYAAKLMIEASPHFKTQVWAIPEMLNYDCVSVDDVLNKYHWEFRDHPINNARKDHINTYWNLIMAGKS